MIRQVSDDSILNSAALSFYSYWLIIEDQL